MLAQNRACLSYEKFRDLYGHPSLYQHSIQDNDEQIMMSWLAQNYHFRGDSQSEIL